MPSPGAVQVLILVLTRCAVTSAQNGSPTPPGPTLSLPCCFASAQNATSLGPVVVLRRDDEQPASMGVGAGPPGTAGAGGDPTWEATLRRAAARALTWKGLAEAPFVASQHSDEVLAALDEPGDIRVLARGLLVADRDSHPVFREVDLPGEQCVGCPADLPGPNGESIKAMWSVRRIRHSGPNEDHRPCYELQFSVTPIVPSLPPLSRWMPPGAAAGAGPEAASVRGLRAGLRAESRVSRQRELRPKGLILRVNPASDTVPLQQLAANALSMADAINRGVAPAEWPRGASMGAPSLGASPGNTVPLQQLAANAFSMQRADAAVLGVPTREPTLMRTSATPGNTVPLQQLAAHVLSTPQRDAVTRATSTLGSTAASTTGTRQSSLQRDAVTRATSTLGSTAASTTGTRQSTPQRVHEHLHHHFYVQGGVPLYAGSTTETEFPMGTSPRTPTATHPFRPSPQYHEYSQPDPLFHPPPGLPTTLTTPLTASLSTSLSGMQAGHSSHVGHAAHGVMVQPSRHPKQQQQQQQQQQLQQTVAADSGSGVHYPNSINEQLPPLRDGSDTRVPYVSATKHSLVTPAGTPVPRPTTQRPSPQPTTTLRFPVDAKDGPTVTILPSTPVSQTQVYRITGGYSFTTPNSMADATRPATRPATKLPSRIAPKATSKRPKAPFKIKNKVVPHNYYEIGRPTKVYPTSSHEEPTEPPNPDDIGLASPTASFTTLRPEGGSTEFLSEYPAGSVRGTTPFRESSTVSSRVPLFTPHYDTQGKGKDFEMSILKVMTSKVPSYIDIFTENGVRVTTTRPGEDDGDDGEDMHTRTSKYSNKYGKHTKSLTTSTRLFKENPRGGPYSLVSNSSELHSAQLHKLSTTLQTRRPDEAEHLAGPVGHSVSDKDQEIETTTPSAPLQITFFVASEDETREPSASTLVSEPHRQDDATTYQYTILRSVEQSINVMKHENDTIYHEPRTVTDLISSTRRSFTSRNEPTGNIHEATNALDANILPHTPDSLSVVNGHTNHINSKAKQVTQNYALLLKNITTEAPTTRKPWRPNTKPRRPWRQRSRYKDFYSPRRDQNQTTTASSVSSVDPTSIVEIRKTYSITASRKRKPSQNQQRKPFLKNQRLNKRREELEYQNGSENLNPSANTDILRAYRVSNPDRRFLHTSQDHTYHLRK